jgi:hypothetical protein
MQYISTHSGEYIISYFSRKPISKAEEEVRADVTITIPNAVIQIPIERPCITAVVPIATTISNLSFTSPNKAR